MTSLNISLPQELQEWIDRRIASGQYADASDYIGDLVRHDQARHQPIGRQLARLRSSTGDADALDFIDAAFTPE